MDPLSDVFALLKVESVLSARIEAAGPWALRFPAYRHVKFGGVIEGARWLWIDGSSERVKLNPGDFYLLTDGRPYCFASDLAAPVLEGVEVMAANLCNDGVVRFGAGHPQTIGAGGRFVFDQEMSGWLVDLLPPVIVIRGDSPQARSLRPALELIQLETETVRPAATVIAASLASIVLVNILRAHLASDAPPVGWLGALGDPKIGEALRSMHAEVQRNWKVADLATAVAMSRTSFSERFRAKVGLPPLEYLTRWRMTLARHVLRSDTDTLATIANKIGYDSETAFGLAFKRMFNESPGRYRARMRVAGSGLSNPASQILEPAFEG
ncbi:AraC family transcriptional regulator [Rhizobium lentis]|uniref:AraC family transcriptional regulator n=1 Tax=Rhizobium lentis TaxID=1138194 RepID=A0A9Q3MEY3_9HYPH|nr:AraC family transcriptional regulator [Rhizobium lentis]MBX4958249.1 AraC family transcriptional regulator [Rhizobium lentis]MBX4976419.1 AraC family transcriptional regulator [Rhizobium lentis]MBX4988253.1 AraC family transcriptional regulator [Rhizobium lentis]MBX4998869.1 AraC family transcriptional regulator [Rhizobium lentis]MBX5006702.1 AraC family transcriptional regulator [Rhizobium lentis]